LTPLHASWIRRVSSVKPGFESDASSSVPASP
ncbi:unnamed protein product, partial [Adineta steineri]